MSETRNSWILESETTIVDSSFVQVLRQECRSSEDASKKHRFFVLRSRDFSNIIPVTADGRVVLVRQYRLGIARHTWEVPGGLNDPTDSDNEASAIREMTEETGYAPLPGAQCKRIASSLANPAIMNNRCYSYIIGPVARVAEQKLDAGEMIDVVEVPIEEVPAMIARGEIDHALIQLAFTALILDHSEGSRLLVEQLGSFTRR